MHFVDDASFLSHRRGLARCFSEPTQPPSVETLLPVFSSTNSRGQAALKLFDQVSCRETLRINWHIGTTTEATISQQLLDF